MINRITQKNRNMKVLVIVAHPDDEVLGMGGTIAKHSSNGDKIHVVYMTTGITSRRNPRYSNKASYEIDEKIKKLKKRRQGIFLENLYRRFLKMSFHR